MKPAWPSPMPNGSWPPGDTHSVGPTPCRLRSQGRLSLAHAPAPDSSSDRKPLASPPMQPNRFSQRLLLGVLALGALALVGWLVYWVATQRHDAEPPSQAQKNKKDREEGGEGKGGGQGQIPVEREIERLCEELALLNRDMRGRINAIVEKEAAIEALQNNIKVMRTNLERQERSLVRMRGT